jgi:hypothetical protein
VFCLVLVLGHYKINPREPVVKRKIFKPEKDTTDDLTITDINKGNIIL